MIDHRNLLTNQVFFVMPEPIVTVPVSAVHDLLEGTLRKGANAAWLDTMLSKANIAQGLLEQAQARVTMSQYIALFSAVKDSLDDECLNLLHGRPMRCGSFALMVRSVPGTPTVACALRRVSQAFALLQDDVTLELIMDGAYHGVALNTREAPDTYADFFYALLLRVFWRLLAWLHGKRLEPKRFDFPFATPANPAFYTQVFSIPPHFAQPRAAVWFDALALEQPLHQCVASVQAFLRATPANLIGPRLIERRFSTRIRTLLQACANEAGKDPWPDLRVVAQQLHLSVSTLQRRLAAENTSFQILKDELRRDLAIVQLTRGDASLAAIASALGFIDSTAFQRAFKHWTGGSTPGAYRMQMRG